MKSAWEGHPREQAFVEFVLYVVGSHDMSDAFMSESGLAIGTSTPDEICNGLIKWCEHEFGTPEQLGCDL